MKLTHFTGDRFPLVSIAYAHSEFVPGNSSHVAVQLAVPSALAQAPPLNKYQTLSTCALSLALPFTCTTALLTRWPASGVLMLNVGRFVSGIAVRIASASASPAEFRTCTA